MDPLDRADALLSRAQARGSYVVTPQSAISPMDAANTQQIPRSVVRGADASAVDPDATTVLTREQIRENDDSHHHLSEPSPTATLPGARGARYGSENQLDGPPRAGREGSVEVEELDGLVPTTKQTAKSSLSHRLDG